MIHPPGLPPHARLSGPCDLRRVTGHVAEELVAERLGISTWTGPDFSVPASFVTHPDDPSSGYATRPDLWWPDETAVVEVKSGFRGRRYYVSCAQLHSYQYVNRYANYPIRRPRVYYAFVGFDHPYTGLSKRDISRLTVGDVMESLRRNHRQVIVAPLSLVSAWARLWGTTGKTWSGPLSPMLGSYDAYYRFTVSKVEAALAAPDYGVGRTGALVQRHATDDVTQLSFPRPARIYAGELPSSALLIPF